MSLFTLIIGILVMGAVIYAVRCIVRVRGMSRATKVLLSTSIAVSLPGLILLLTGYVEIGSALVGIAGAMTLLEGYLRHRSKPNAAQSE